MEVSVEKCQQMIDTCKAAKRMLAIGYRSRFEPHNLDCIRPIVGRELAWIGWQFRKAQQHEIILRDLRSTSPVRFQFDRAGVRFFGAAPKMSVMGAAD